MSLLILSENKLKPSVISLRGLFILTLLGLQLLVFSCGLPTYAYLYPPDNVRDRSVPSDDESDLIFRNAYKNNSNFFSGYELYYKIYDPLDSSTSETQYRTDSSAIDSTVTGYTSLKNKGFERLFTTVDIDSAFSHNDTKPGFGIEGDLLDENFDIRLLFLQEQPAGSSYFASTYESSESFSEKPYIYRFVENESTGKSEMKFFDSYDFSIYDSDMPSTVDTNSMNVSNYYLYISFYILSFGRDPKNITNMIYSVPVYLGTRKFDCVLQE